MKMEKTVRDASKSLLFCFSISKVIVVLRIIAIYIPLPQSSPTKQGGVTYFSLKTHKVTLVIQYIVSFYQSLV